MNAPSTTPLASLAMINIDCADPRAMAAFYGQLLGAEIPHSEDEYSMVVSGDTSIGFGRIPDYAAPPWPDPEGRKQFHLDFRVADLDAAEATCRKLGATVPDEQPGEGRWRVLLDPVRTPVLHRRVLSNRRSSSTEPGRTGTLRPEQSFS